MGHAENQDRLPLGAAPRPATGEDLAARVRAAVLAELGPDVEGEPTVRATMSGPDVPALALDLTGVRVRLADAPDQEAPAAPAATVTGRERGTLGELRLTALPIHLGPVPVEVTAQVHRLPIEWVTTSDDAVALALPAEAGVSGQAEEAGSGTEGGPGPTGRVVVSAPKDAAVEAMRQALELGLAEAGMTLASFDLEISQVGPRRLEVAGSGRIRKGLLSASARGQATVTFTEDLTIRLSDVRVTSANPVIAAVLLGVRGRIARSAEAPIALGEALPAGLRLTDLQVTAGHRLTLDARF